MAASCAKLGGDVTTATDTSFIANTAIMSSASASIVDHFDRAATNHVDTTGTAASSIGPYHRSAGRLARSRHGQRQYQLPFIHDTCPITQPASAMPIIAVMIGSSQVA